MAGRFRPPRFATRRARVAPPLLVPAAVARYLYSWGRLEQHQATVVIRGLSYALLFAFLFGLYLAVRFGGIALESQFPASSPKVIAALLYPWLAIGLPACAYLAGRDLNPVRSFATAAAAIGAAIVVDYQYLAVTVLRLDVVLHRFGIVVALGFVASGAVSRQSRVETVNWLVAIGLSLWVFLLVAPLVGWL